MERKRSSRRAPGSAHGRYVVVPMYEDARTLSPEEEACIEAALESSGSIASSALHGPEKSSMQLSGVDTDLPTRGSSRSVASAPSYRVGHRALGGQTGGEISNEHETSFERSRMGHWHSPRARIGTLHSDGDRSHISQGALRRDPTKPSPARASSTCHKSRDGASKLLVITISRSDALLIEVVLWDVIDLPCHRFFVRGPLDSFGRVLG
jgi:hypothetical protein